MSFDIEFKGTKNGIILRYNPKLDYAQFRNRLITKLESANRFFEGSHIIGLEGPQFNAEQEAEISRLIRDLGGMKVLSLEVVNHIDALKKAQKSALIAEAKSSLSQVSEQMSDVSEQVVQTIADEHHSAIIHHGTLRSGSRIDSDSDIVLLGDANPGSELSAAGHIIVLGALRGLAHAGKKGDDNCYIIALKLQPSQIRIGNHITRAPDDGGLEPDYAEIAFVKNSQIIIEPYRK